MGIEAMAVSIPEFATPLAKEISPPNSQKIIEIGVGTFTLCLGAAIMLDGLANNNQMETCVGFLMCSYGLSQISR